MEQVISINSIAVDPAVRSGRPYIIGTSVTVADVVIAHVYHRLDADGIADWYNLTLAQTHAALAYYFEHKAETDELVRALIRRADALLETRPGNERSLVHF
jgi:uncharacterized protein (DUF433 family)